MKYEVLLADDDDSVRLVLSKALSRAGHNVKATDNAQTLLKWAEAGQGDIILTDVMMGGQEVFTTLPAITEARPKVPIIVISANNTVNTALKAGQHKVFEYVPKPFDLEDITNAVSRAGQSLVPKRARAGAKSKGLPMIGRSAAMQPVYRAVSRFSDSDLPILIQGAVGTGKDLVARLLHDGGARASRPFLRTSDFENTSLTLQKVNGGDLYMLYRINVAEIRIPPLADRDRDTYELAESFLSQASYGQNRRFASDALDILHRHDWDGNVRELENLVRRLSVLYSDDVITADMVLQEFSKDIRQRESRNTGKERFEKKMEEACQTLLNDEEFIHDESVYQTALNWVERPLIVEALRLTGGNRAKAAEKLGIHRNTLRTRLKSLDIS